MNLKYNIIKQIGQGQYGQIFLATLKDCPHIKHQFAIKKINNEYIDAEHMLLPQINHPNILKVHEIIRE
jgi:serine/threonine protein kinase